MTEESGFPPSPRHINFDRLWDLVPRGFALGLQSTHGPNHWRRVEAFGLQIAKHTPGVDIDVIRLFALFHDCRRENENRDPGHGARGAALAFDLYHQEFRQLEDMAFDRLITACCWHTHRTHTDDLTIGACFDSDRLDLGRIGIIPEASYFNTAIARQWAAAISSPAI
jgi:uncharacterized protein